jgi:hypothetical protein
VCLRGKKLKSENFNKNLSRLFVGKPNDRFWKMGFDVYEI